MIGTLFDHATKARDYDTIRVWGPSFIGILVTISGIIISVAEIISISYFLSKIKTFNEYELSKTSTIPKNIGNLYFIGIGIIIVQNIGFFILISVIQIILTLDLIGYIILGMLTVNFGRINIENKYFFGGFSLIIWVFISFLWRNGIGLYSSNFGSLSSNDATLKVSSVMELIFIGNLFLGIGIYHCFSFLCFEFKKLKWFIYLYVFSNLICSFLLLIFPGLGIYLKIFFVPLVGVLTFTIVLIYFSKYRKISNT
jgi:hypothetical protein